MYGRTRVVVVALVGVASVAAILIAARTDSESATAVTAAVGVVGTVVVSVLNFLQAGDTQRLAIRAERSRLREQHRHESRSTQRSLILSARAEQIVLLRRALATIVGGTDQVYRAVTYAGMPRDLRAQAREWLDRGWRDIEDRADLETRPEVVLIGISDNDLRRQFRECQQALIDLSAIAGRYLPEDANAVLGQDRIDAFVREWQAVYPAVTERLGEFAARVEVYLSGADLDIAQQ